MLLVEADIQSTDHPFANFAREEAACEKQTVYLLAYHINMILEDKPSAFRRLGRRKFEYTLKDSIVTFSTNMLPLLSKPTRFAQFILGLGDSIKPFQPSLDPTLFIWHQ